MRDKVDSRLPNPGYFPFEYIDVRVPTTGHFNEDEILNSGATIRVVKNRNRTNNPSTSEVVVAETYSTDLASTLQYGQGFGDLKLREFAREHIKVCIFLYSADCRWFIRRLMKTGISRFQLEIPLRLRHV